MPLPSVRYSPKSFFFLFMMLWLSRASSTSEPENNKCKEDFDYCQLYSINSACFEYCEYGFHTEAHSNICDAIKDKVISFEQVLQLPDDQLSRLNGITRYTSYNPSLYSLLESKQIPIMHLLKLPEEEFSYFDEYYHEQVIGLSRLIHAGKLTYDEALSLIRSDSLPYQLNNLIIHQLILNNKLSIDEAARIDSETMVKLNKYNSIFIPTLWRYQGTFERLFRDTDLKLNDFLHYPAEFIDHVVDNFYLVDALADKTLTLDEIYKLYRMSDTVTPDKIVPLGTRFYRVTDFKDLRGDGVRLLDLIMQRIVDVDFVVRLSYRQVTQLNACAEMIKAGLAPSDVLEVFEKLSNVRYQQLSAILEKKENRMFIIEHNLLKKSSLIVMSLYGVEAFKETMRLVKEEPTLSVIKTIKCVFYQNKRDSFPSKAINFVCDTMKFFKPSIQCGESMLCDGIDTTLIQSKAEL